MKNLFAYLCVISFFAALTLLSIGVLTKEADFIWGCGIALSLVIAFYALMCAEHLMDEVQKLTNLLTRRQ